MSLTHQTRRPGEYVRLTEQETVDAIEIGNYILWHELNGDRQVFESLVLDKGTTGVLIEDERVMTNAGGLILKGHPTTKKRRWIDASQIIFLT